MGRKKINTKVDYDRTYPPLKQPVETGADSTKPKKTAFQAVMSEVDGDNKVIIQANDRRFKNNDPELVEFIKRISSAYGVGVKYKTSNLGSLCITIEAEDEKIKKSVKFLLQDGLSQQTRRTLKLDDQILRRFVDKKQQNRLIGDRSATIKVDFTAGTLNIEGGRESVRLVGNAIDEFLSWNTNITSLSLEIPRVYHNFIQGVENENLKCIVDNSGRFVTVSFSETCDTVSLTGNKICVEKARDNILKYYEDLKTSLKRRCYKLSHLQRSEIFKRLPPDLFQSQGVSIYCQPMDETQCSFDIVGESEKLDLIHQIIVDICDHFSCTKVSCPYWVCKNLSLMGEFGKAFASLFPESSCQIYPLSECIEVTCPSNISSQAVEKLSSIVDDISSSLTYSTVIFPDVVWKSLNPHGRTRLNEIESKTATNFFTETNLGNREFIGLQLAKTDVLCTIVGAHLQVAQAKRLIEELKLYYESFISVSIEVPNHLHRYLIGSKGRTLRSVIDENGPSCTVSFGKEDPNLDCCTVRGPPNEVGAVVGSIKNKATEFDALHHLIDIEIPQSIRSLLSYNKENFLSELKKKGPLEYIDFSSSFDSITLMGKLDLIQSCKVFIESHFNELLQSIEKEVNVPPRLSSFIPNFQIPLLKSICEDAGGGVHAELVFSGPSQTIKFIGSQVNVTSAIQILKDMSSESLYSFEILKVPMQNISSLKNTIPSIVGSSNVHVLFSNNKKNFSFLLVGKPAEVSIIKQTLLDKVHVLQNTIEKSIMIKSQYKKEFLKKYGNEPTLVQKLSAEHNNVRITVGNRQASVDTVLLTVKGFKEDVEKLLISIDNLIRTFDSRIERSVEFEISHLYTVLSECRYLLKSTMTQFDVVISVSEDYYESIRSNKFEGSCKIFVRGLPNNVERALDYLRNWEVVSQEIPCACALQKALFSSKSFHGSILYHNHSVKLDLGCFHDLHKPVMTVSGLKIHVQSSVQYIQRVIDDNFLLEVSIPRQYFTRLVGRKGSSISKFNTEYNVRVSVPFDDEDGLVTITGKREDCQLAAEKLKQMVDVWASVISKEFEFDSRIRQKLVGPENANLRQINADYNVQIRILPPIDKTDPLRRLRISGLPKNVEDVYSFLTTRVQQLMDDLEEQHLYQDIGDRTYHLDINSISTTVYGDPKKTRKKKANLPSNGDSYSPLNQSNNIPDSEQLNGFPEHPVDSL